MKIKLLDLENMYYGKLNGDFMANFGGFFGYF